MAFSKPSRLLSEGFPGLSWPDGVTGLPCCSSRALAHLARAARVPWQKLGAACPQPCWEELPSIAGVCFCSVSRAKPAGRCGTNGRFHFCTSLEAEQKEKKAMSEKCTQLNRVEQNSVDFLLQWMKSRKPWQQVLLGSAECVMAHPASPAAPKPSPQHHGCHRARRCASIALQERGCPAQGRGCGARVEAEHQSGGESCGRQVGVIH